MDTSLILLLLGEWRAPVTLGPSEFLPTLSPFDTLYLQRPTLSLPPATRAPLRELWNVLHRGTRWVLTPEVHYVPKPGPELSTLKTVRFPKISGVPEY